MFERLDQIEARYEELTQALASPDIVNDSARYQKTAKVNQVYDDGARKKLLEKLNRVAANLGLAVIEDPTKAQAKPAPEAAPTPEPGEPKGPAADKEKTPWGVGASA